MPSKTLILALYKSNLDPKILHLLWKEQGHPSEQVFKLLLSALESSTEDHPEILHLLLAECAPHYTTK